MPAATAYPDSTVSSIFLLIVSRQRGARFPSFYTTYYYVRVLANLGHPQTREYPNVEISVYAGETRVQTKIK